MDKRTTGIIATVATALLCGCPGLFSVCFGALAAIISFVPDAEIDMFGSSDPQTALGYGIGAFCVGILFVLVPVAVGFFTLRKKKVDEAALNEPLPPVS